MEVKACQASAPRPWGAEWAWGAAGSVRANCALPTDRAVRLRLPGQCQQLPHHGAQRLPFQRCPPWRVSGHCPAKCAGVPTTSGQRGSAGGSPPEPPALDSDHRQPWAGMCPGARPHVRTHVSQGKGPGGLRTWGRLWSGSACPEAHALPLAVDLGLLACQAACPQPRPLAVAQPRVSLASSCPACRVRACTERLVRLLGGLCAEDMSHVARPTWAAAFHPSCLYPGLPGPNRPSPNCALGLPVAPSRRHGRWNLGRAHVWGEPGSGFQELFSVQVTQTFILQTGGPLCPSVHGQGPPCIPFEADSLLGSTHLIKELEPLQIRDGQALPTPTGRSRGSL